MLKIEQILNRNCKVSRGFTLIELMIVMLIISILSCLAIPIFQNIKTKIEISNILTYCSELDREITLCLTESGVNGVAPAFDAIENYRDTWIDEHGSSPVKIGWCVMCGGAGVVFSIVFIGDAPNYEYTICARFYRVNGETGWVAVTDTPFYNYVKSLLSGNIYECDNSSVVDFTSDLVR
ncbi:MAG: prepilin-type N-terminal cleavage/methylation domain-containing protein [Candidatus Omnitrophica bacterium]|nr:prepilin-type N-terminal cleavage/methylation domain-containing protein [Candidatus Omnitrophota bacterium]